MARHDSESRKSDRELLEEISARARRTETRVTMLAEAAGLGVGEKPTYDPVQHRVEISTRKTSIDDILAAIDDDVATVNVFCKGEFVGSVCPA